MTTGKALVAIGVLAAVVAPRAAWAAAMLPVETLMQQARDHNPAVEAARQRYLAASARISGQGVRPDPMVEAGVMSLWGFMGPQVSVSQTFPLGGKLGAEQTVARAEAAVAFQSYRQIVNDLQSEVGRTYYDLYVLQQAATIVDKNKQVLGQMAKIASARYAVGQGKQSDVIRTNTQVAEMLHEAVMVRQQRESASAKLMGLLNQSAPAGHIHEGAIATPATPAFERKPDELLALASSQNPGILMAQADVVVGEATLAAARTLAAPDLTAKVGLGQAYMDMGWQTVLSGMVGTNLPMGSRERQRSAVAAAEADLAARRAALANRRREVEVALRQALTHVRHLSEQLRLYRQGLLPQARLAIQSELANYQVGRSDFDAVLAAQMSQFRTEREYHQAIADYRKMLVEIEAQTAEHVPAAKEAP